MAFGTSVTVARGVAVLLGIVSALLLYAAARLLVSNAHGALVGALLASCFPWAARLGVATVPELFAASLSVFALATLAHRRPDIRLLGAVALLAATLSRYEPWLLAAGFAAYSLKDARVAQTHRRRFAIAATVATIGPMAWIAHNLARYGDPLRFLARVSAYKRAVSGAAGGVWDLLLGYPLALVREEPELCIVAAVLLGCRRSIPESFRRPAVCLGMMLALLSVAALPGGAPTHHGGRAVLAVWLVLAIGVGEGARVALRSRHRVSFTVLVIAVMPLGAWLLRPWYARLDSFVTRADELAIGAAVADQLVDERALVETRDYGFFAIQAGTGLPHRVLLDREVDPRSVRGLSRFATEEDVRQAAAERGASIVIAYVTPVTRKLGSPLATVGLWGAWRLGPRRPSD